MPFAVECFGDPTGTGSQHDSPLGLNIFYLVCYENILILFFSLPAWILASFVEWVGFVTNRFSWNKGFCVPYTQHFVTVTAMSLSTFKYVFKSKYPGIEISIDFDYQISITKKSTHQEAIIRLLWNFVCMNVLNLHAKEIKIRCPMNE